MYSQPNRIKYAFDVTCAGATSEFAIRGPKGKSGKPWDWGVEGVTTALTSACTVAIGTTADPDAYGEEFAVGGTAAEDAASVRNTYLPNAAPLDTSVDVSDFVVGETSGDTKVIMTVVQSSDGAGTFWCIMDWQD